MISTGIFSRRKEKQEEKPNYAQLLNMFSDITSDDIDKLIDIATNKRDVRDYGDKVNSYLNLVKAIFGKTDSFSLGDTVQTRQQRYEIYDEMDTSTAYISAALDILSDDATQPDNNGVILSINSESPKVQSIVEDLFDRIGVEERLSKWARAIAKYGDFFIKINTDEDDNKINSVNDTIYPGTLERKELEGKLLAFSDAQGSMSLGDNIYAPWEFVHFRHKGDIYRSQQAGRFSTLAEGHEAYSLTSAYGQSILRPAIKVYAQLRFVENLIILSRMTNSIRRNIFLINTGEVEPDKAFDTIRSYADLLKKDISLDVESGLFNTQKHTVNYDEDIFIPVTDTKNDVRIESVGGDVNISEQYDLEYLLNKLFAALKIPKAYLNYEQDLNARSTLIQLDIRYARSVGQLQTTLIAGLTRLANIELAYHGLNPDDVDLEIKLTTVSSMDEEAKLEQKRVSIESAKVMWDMLITMNDKLTEIKGGNNSPSAPSLGGGGGLEDLFASNDPSQSDKKDSPLDLDYVTEHILSNYFKLDQADVNKILRKPDEENKESRKVVRKKKHLDSDMRQMYPNQRNRDEFVKIRESLITPVDETSNKVSSEK